MIQVLAPRLRLLALIFALGAAAPACAATPGARALDDVRILSDDAMQGRAPGTPGSALARAHILKRFGEIGLAPIGAGFEQPFSFTRRDGTQVAAINLVARIPGTATGGKVMVVSAHYDHLGVKDGEIFNGADDNASGVATMLELAKRLKAQAPEHSVLLVAFDGEERGLLGAREFVKAPPVPLSSIALNLNFDMTARAETDGHLWVTGTYQHPNLRPILEPLPAVGPVSFAFGKDTPQDEGENNWVSASDQGAFHDKGVPFLYMGIDYHPDYHRPTDDFERIRPEVFTAATELAIAGFRALDRSLDR